MLWVKLSPGNIPAEGRLVAIETAWVVLAPDWAWHFIFGGPPEELWAYLLLPGVWMGAKRSQKAKEKGDGAGRGTGKARNPGALSTVRPVKSPEEEGGLFGVGSLLSMMWRHKERRAVSIGGQNSTDPVLSLGLICSTVSHLCPEVSWVERGRLSAFR